MKILGVSFSPREGGNTETLINHALRGAQQDGARTELYSFVGKHVEVCDGCRTCDKGVCHIQDDMQELYKKLVEADGIIFGSPTFFYTMASQGKVFMDRTMALSTPDKTLANKVGGIVAVAGSFGLIEVVKDWYFYIVTRGMLPANFVAAYGRDAGDVANLEKCMQATFDLGRQMVALANKKFEYPKEFNKRAIAYGTHTK